VRSIDDIKAGISQLGQLVWKELVAGKAFAYTLLATALKPSCNDVELTLE